MEGERCVRVLCPAKMAGFSREPGVYWLVGSPLFLPPITIVTALRCLHRHQSDAYSPDYEKEADGLRTLILRGFDVVGALFVGNTKWEDNAQKAVDASLKMKRLIQSETIGHDIVGAAADSETMDIHFYASESRTPSTLQPIGVVHNEDIPENFLWENGCLLRCQLEFRLPVYVPGNGTSDMLYSSIDAAIAKLRDPQVVYLIEGIGATQQSFLLRGTELSSDIDASDNKPEGTDPISKKNTLPCSYFLPVSKGFSSSTRKSADAIQVRVFFSKSGNSTKSSAPVAEYFPSPESVRLIAVNFKVDVLCYASRDFPVFSAISRLVIPGIADQLTTLQKAIASKLLSEQYEFCPYHFCPPGVLHPITAIYDRRREESEKLQANIRKSLHLRLGLPLDRPLLLVANSLVFSDDNMGTSMSRISGVIRDVHVDIPRSGVSGGLASLVQGPYEYYHYLQDGYDDSGWGCAYRSLQTIISWFKLQNYTSIQVPSHREIQQALVEIGDKEPYFVGSREWIGAIELSFVLDKLLGVSCKIINVRSGAELPEKCRELSLHFETQGTPVMIGGGVLAYTLLGVDYNEVSGDCAFLILDPHYTGSDDRKKIMNGGWCGWKKPVDSKGRNFFLHDRFYNLLLPQRPNMV